LVAPSADTSPGALAESASWRSPGGQASMAQFLQIPAKDKAASVAGPDSYRDVQSRNSEFGR